MAQRKGDASGIIPSPSANCWWSDEVLSPQSQTTVSYRDFVLISEFSELEGPLPLAIVADSAYIDLKHYTHKQSTAVTSETRSLEEDLKKIGLDSFDFNAFVLRVVSVDRSTEYEQIDEETLEITPISPSAVLEGEEEIQKPCLFSIPDDTQVYFTDSEHKFFAFTHHLTLFDINARGYVHPVALSYITRDPDKIVIRFEELMERFNEVSIRMKKGNYSNFTLDLKCRLLDLEYTQSNTNLQQQKPALSMQAIQQAITATKLMIDTLESSTSQINNMTSTPDSDTTVLPPPPPPKEDPKHDKNPIPLRKSLSKKLLNMKKALTEDEDDHDSTSIKNQFSIDPPKDYKPKCIDTLYPVPHFERKLRSLAQLCQEPEEEPDQVARNNRPTLTHKTAAMIPLVFSMIEPSTTPVMSTSSLAAATDTITPTTVSNGRPSFAAAITHDMYAEAIKYIQDMTHYLGKSSVVLDVDEEERLFVDPVTSALTIGRTFMLNMDNPQPREPEEQSAPASPTSKEEPIEKTNDKDTNPYSNSSISKPTSSVETNTTNTDSQDTLNDTSTANDNDDDYPILFAPFQLWQPSKIRLLEVLRRYQSLIVDVIFSLLIGRTVLIQGSTQNKSLVQQVVRALSVFVPGQSRHRHQIIEWFETRRLTDTQIKSIKLVGIDKDNMDSSIHVDSSCVLDIDVKNGSLNSSPVYVEGQWINQLLDRMMLFSSDESYLAYLHTVFMTMSLKAFIYHHLYVCDEFKLDDETPPTSSTTSNKGYVSETNSEISSSMLSRKWSQRLMSYLKKHEDVDSDAPTPSPAPVLATTTSSRASSIATEEEDYSEENQATVTLQNLLLHQQQQQQQQSATDSNKPRTLVGMFEQPTTTRRASISTTYSHESFSSSNSDGSDQSALAATAYLNNFGDADELMMNYNDDDHQESSSGESEQEEKQKVERKGKHRYARRKPSNVGEDGVSLTERRGRRYLQDKLKVYGDDQTIVVYLATCVL